MFRIILAFGLFLGFFSCPTAGFAKTVTTYVVTTQEERENTRFTLTEWLRIKERMKMMDLWLALFSEPAKEKFSPELSLLYNKISGLGKISNHSTGAAKTKLPNGTYSGQEGQAQLWLTNLISTTLGIRTLNIDFGLETYLEKGQTSYPSGSPLLTHSSLRYNSVDFRIFGKNIQDSSIVLKGGQFTNQTGALNYGLGSSQQSFSGNMLGAELQLYVMRWLGLEGSYLNFMAPGSAAHFSLDNQSYTYGLFIEVSLIRLRGGYFSENSTYQSGSKNLQEQNQGTFFGLQISL